MMLYGHIPSVPRVPLCILLCYPLPFDCLIDILLIDFDCCVIKLFQQKVFLDFGQHFCCRTHPPTPIETDDKPKGSDTQCGGDDATASSDIP